MVEAACGGPNKITNKQRERRFNYLIIVSCDKLTSKMERDSMTLEGAIRTHALHLAKKAVVEDLRRQGLKVREYAAKEIAIRADAYLDAHVETLIPEAARSVVTWPICRRLVTVPKSYQSLTRGWRLSYGQ
jgi:hypothetical protein